MAYDNTITIVGNVTRDPEQKSTAGGLSITNFGVAWNKRKKEGEDETSFYDVSCFRDLADNVARSVKKGDRVVIYGSIEQSRWETPEGDKRSKHQIVADDISLSLKWASATAERNPREGGFKSASAPAAAPAFNRSDEPF